MALSVLSDSCGGPALQEEARISPEMGINKKIPLSALPTCAAFAFPNQWLLFWSAILLTSCFSYHPAGLENLNLQFLTGKVKSMSQDGIQQSGDTWGS